MQHKGEILEKAVRESGMSLTKLTQRLSKSRRWIYNAFDNPNVPIDYILEIGKIIHHDFSEDIIELKKYRKMTTEVSLDHNYLNPENNTTDYWKIKYLNLLEKYNLLLEKNSL